MKIVIVTVSFLTTCLFVLALDVKAPKQPEDPVVGEMATEIGIALSEVPQDEAVESVLRKYLLDDRHEVRIVALGFIQNNARWLDIRGCQAVLLEFDELESCNMGAMMIARFNLFAEPRAVRKAIYEEAIESGSSRYSRILEVSRWQAMRYAAVEGIEELQPLIHEYFEVLPLGAQRTTPLSWLDAQMNLREGADTGEEAAVLAARRIAEIDDQVFFESMDNDEGFRKAVLQTALYVCASDPFRGGSYGRGCDLLADVAHRQRTLSIAREKQLHSGEPNWSGSLSKICRPAMETTKDTGAK